MPLPAHLRRFSPDELAVLDAYCRRALDDPDAEPRAGHDAAAVARYEALLAGRARERWQASTGGEQRKTPSGGSTADHRA